MTSLCSISFPLACPIYVVLTGNAAVNIAAIGNLLLYTVSNLTDLHSDYSSLIHFTALKHLLQSWNNETQSKSCMQ